MPWFGNRVMRVDSLDQLYTEVRVHRGENSSSEQYKLCAVTKDGAKVVLLSGLSEKDQTRFIEERIENFLGIEHRPVPGEAAR
jgi:hypothetical protein